MAQLENKKARFLPDYEIIEIKEPITVRKAKYISGVKREGEKAQPGHFEFTDVVLDIGWLVCYPRRHSVLYTSEVEMVRLGYGEYVDVEDKKGETTRQFQLVRPAVTDHQTGLRLEGDAHIMSLASQIAATTSLKKMSKIPVTIGSPS